MQEVYLWPINADQEGTPDQVEAVIRQMRDNDIPVLFCESTVNAMPMEMVASETGAQFSGSLYVDSLTSPTATPRPISICSKQRRDDLRGLPERTVNAMRLRPRWNHTRDLGERITVDYNGFVALHDASLDVPRGAICALVGMNGAGKSTLFKAIMGFLRPASGRVLIEGRAGGAAQKRGGWPICHRPRKSIGPFRSTSRMW